MTDNKPKNSPAKIAANNRYNAKHYRQIKANIKPDDYTLIDEYCKLTNISKASFIVAACKAWIESHPINENDDQLIKS